MKEAIKKASVLIEALPYIKNFHKKVTVIKYGGSILAEERVRKSVLEDIAFLRYTGMRPILVHGGGPNITERLKELKLTSEFVDGIRVTDKKTLAVVEEELNKLNRTIVEEISSHGIKAKGFKREDGLLIARKKDNERDLGFVGEVVNLEREKLDSILPDAIPVICPMGVSSEGVVYNINADEVACFIAGKLAAEKLVFLTNVLGVMRNARDEDSLISSLTKKETQDLIKTRIIDEGMIPKVKSALAAITMKVKKSHIIDAKIPHALLLEIFTDEGIGTEIVA
ncbi:MAG: acetylglutamate kinase [Candidatus Omnitrophota bacterium]